MNKRSTKAEARVDVAAAGWIPQEAKQVLLEQAASRHLVQGQARYFIIILD